jgi:hypothetical protein
MIKPCGIRSLPSSHTANCGMRRGENYSIKEWKKNRKKVRNQAMGRCSLIENPNKKSARNSSIGIYLDSTLLSKTTLAKGKTSPQAGSRLNFGEALVFGCYSTSVELSLSSESHRLQCLSIFFTTSG